MKQLRAHKILAISGIVIYIAAIILNIIDEYRPRSGQWIDIPIDFATILNTWDYILMWSIMLMPVIFLAIALYWNYKKRRQQGTKNLYTAAVISGILCLAGLIFFAITSWADFAETYSQPTVLSQIIYFVSPPDYAGKGIDLTINICISLLLLVCLGMLILQFLVRDSKNETADNPVPAV